MTSDIVITGLAGRFPECDNVDELRDKLFAGVDLVTEDDRRWPMGLHGLPKRNGKLKDLSRFDAMFFGVSPRQASAMDPGLRILLETTYEAIVDAGYNPEELRGKKIGVFVGQAFSESMANLASDPETLSGYGMSGTQRAMMANRISYAFDFNGPSYNLDTACSSSLYAFDHAVKAIERGEIEAAFVGGVNVLLSATTSLYFYRLNMIGDDGMCKAFDASGKGYVRSEAVGMVFVQKRKDARRLYASVVGTNTNSDGFKEKGISFPSGSMQKAMIEDVFRRVAVKPSEISYVEAHGTGTKAGDPEELNAIDAIFCKEPRSSPLLVGSVKSNLGHSESAAGFIQIAKVVIAMESGAIPGNLHYETPNPSIPGLVNGNLQVVSKNLTWDAGYAAINSFGFGGANAHLILEPHKKIKVPIEAAKIPKLVTCSATTEAGVESLLKRANMYKEDAEFQALLHSSFKRNISGHTCRGFSILGKTSADIEVSVPKREVWFVFSGMGTQWVGMGRDLMVFEPFARGLQKCANALKTVGIDLMDVLLNCDESSFNVLNSFISISSIQVGLIDLLTSLGVSPDGLVGHSAGEIVCGYVDGSLTAEQAVLCSYWRGRCILDSKLPQGAMAAVAGLTWDQVKAKLPPNVYAACHNSTDSVTISSDAETMKKCVAQFESEGITVRHINSSGCGFHSKHVSAAAPALKQALLKVIPNPKPRSTKWISSCVVESSWDEPWAKMSCAEYHTHNLTSPVLFKEAVDKIPDGSLIVEIAPHALLSGLLRKSVANSVVVSLAKKGVPDGVQYCLSNLGKLYNAGVALDLANLYPKVDFPVGRGTPMIAPAIVWDHQVEWHVPYEEQNSGGSSGFVKEVNTAKDEDGFLIGHKIDGRVLYPFTGYVTLVWRAFAKKLGKLYEKCPVVIENFQVQQATILSKDAPVKLAVCIFDGSNEFELTQGESVVATGKIRHLSPDGGTVDSKWPTPSSASSTMADDDFYKELRLKGYEYGGEFRGVKSCSIDGLQGILNWTGNWVTLMDAMLQVNVYNRRTRELFLPTRINKIVIDPIQHEKLVDRKTQIPVHFNENLHRLRCGGVEIHSVKFSHAKRRPVQQKPTMEEHKFVPYIQNKTVLKEDAITVALQVVLENIESSVKIKILEIGKSPNLLHSQVAAILRREPSVIADISVAAFGQDIDSAPEGIKIWEPPTLEAALSGNWDLILGADLLSDKSAMATVVGNLSKNCFLLIDVAIGTDLKVLDKNLELIVKSDCGERILLLCRKVREWVKPDIIDITSRNFGWVKKVQNWLAVHREAKKNLLIVSRGEPNSGVLGFIRCLRLENSSTPIRSLMLPDVSDVSEELSLDPYVSQLKKDLTINVLRRHVWGSMRHLPLERYLQKRIPSEHAYVNTLVLGDLSSLEWIQGPLINFREHLSHGKELCSVYYAPLNFRDIMLATGKLPPDALPGNLAGQECILGLEFAGRDKTGRRVMGIVEACGLATTVAADQGFLWEVPPSWTLEEASTVPIAYSTAYYALIVRGQLQKGESVLIHAGTGGVGLAAINIALNLGCKVFTTVGSPQKRAFLKENFPLLKDNVIGNSRDASFEERVLEETKGRGVDVVLNSLAGELLQSSVRCMAQHGRFLEIGKVDLSKNTALGMSVFLKNTSVHGILLDALFSVQKDHPEKREVAELMRNGIRTGQVRPLPAAVFQYDQLEQSFRYMATGKHIGKVVLRIREEEKCSVVIPEKNLIPAIPRFYAEAEKSYVLVGGLGGFGLELADWLVNRGARSLVLTSRSGVTTGYQAVRLKRWEESGVAVKVCQADCQSLDEAMDLLKEAASFGEIGAIYNLAGVIRDARFDEQTEESFEAVCAAKITGTESLDLASRSACPRLDSFVVFSSVSCGRGNVGQTNYGYANSAMERICEERRQIGLPALAIQWGAIGDVGMVMKDLQGHNETKVAGTVPQRISSCLASLDVLLTCGRTVVACAVLADKDAGTAAGPDSLNIVDAVANILGIKDPKSAGAATLGELGMDSLMGTEIKQSLEINFDLVLSHQDIRNLNFPSLEQLGSKAGKVGSAKATKAARKLTVVPDSPIRKMTSKSSDGSSDLPVFMIHPIQGTVDSLEELANQIERPVWGLQCTKIAPMDSAGSLAAHYLQAIRTKQATGPYTIVAYSFGAVIALEMAAILEADNEYVSLTLVEGSPEFSKGHIRIYTNNRINPDDLDGFRWPYVATLFTDLDYSYVTANLKNLPSREERLKFCSELVGCSRETFETAVDLFWKKVDICRKFEPSRKPASSRIRLLKASQKFVDNVADDYGLSKDCDCPVEVITIPSTTHQTIISGDGAERVAHIVNSN